MNAGSSLAIDYLGQIQLQQPITPESDAVNAVCHYAEAHPQRAEEMMYCGALMARMEHRRGETKPSPGALRWLSTAAQLAPHLALARCELGKNLAWAGEWYPAQTQMEACVRLEPDSAEGHYRLAQIYLHLGQTERARRETILHNQVMRHMVAANAQRDATLKKFLYTMTENAATVR